MKLLSCIHPAIFAVLVLAGCQTPKPTDANDPGMVPMISTIDDPSFLILVTEKEKEQYLVRAKRGEMYAMNKLVQYYLENDDPDRAEYWSELRDKAEVQQRKRP